jgi:hypothetical protein
MAASGQLSRLRSASESAFSPEIGSLVDLARRAIDNSVQVPDFPATLDWNRLLFLSELHGLDAFLLRDLRRSAVAVPEHVLNRLTRASSQVAPRNLALGRELLKLSSVLRIKGIDHLAYKGPALGQMLYGNLALRHSSDIDLLVHPEQAEFAIAVLKELGYEDKDRLNSRQIRAAIRYGAEHCLARAGIDVDLHWRFAPAAVSRSLKVDHIWKRSIAVPLFGSELPTLCPEDLFVTLCLHASEHGWSQLSLFCDLGRLLAISPNFDWDIVHEHTEDENTRRAVDVTVLLLAESCLGVAVPGSELRREMQVELLAAKVAGGFWPAPERAPHQETNLGWIRERCRGERMKSRLQWIGGVVLTPTLADIKAVHLPAILTWLYPGIRMVRLLARHANRNDTVIHAETT